LVAAAKFSVAATKISFVVPNFVAVTKPFFPFYLKNPDYATFIPKRGMILPKTRFFGGE